MKKKFRISFCLFLVNQGSGAKTFYQNYGIQQPSTSMNCWIPPPWRKFDLLFWTKTYFSNPENALVFDHFGFPVGQDTNPRCQWKKNNFIRQPFIRPKLFIDRKFDWMRTNRGSIARKKWILSTKRKRHC